MNALWEWYKNVHNNIIGNNQKTKVSQVGSVVKKKNLPANVGDTGDVCSTFGLERYPGEGKDSPLQYSCLAKIPWMEKPGGLYSMGLQRVGHD